jgi:N-acetylneuraminic acid mutarotase
MKMFIKMKKYLIILLLGITCLPIQSLAVNTLDRIYLSASSTPFAVYSLRRLSSAYQGPAIRVRRSADNQEKDIYFNPLGDLDESTLKHFVISGSAFVTKWYDQSGNNYHATQSIQSRQPLIVFLGVLQTINSRPTIFFDGSNTFLQASTAPIPATMPHTLNAIAAATTGNIVALSSTQTAHQNSCLGAGFSSNGAAWFGGYGQDNSYTAGTTTSSPTVRTKTYASGQINGYIGGIPLFNTSVSYTLMNDDILLGVQDLAFHQFLSGKLSEVIVLNTSLQTNNPERLKMECSQANYYGLSLVGSSAIVTQPSTTHQSLCTTNAFPALSVSVGGGTSFTYQWYRNRYPVNTGGQIISGANASTYTPSLDSMGEWYYYVTAFNQNGYMAISNPSGRHWMKKPWTEISAYPNAPCQNKHCTLNALSTSNGNWEHTDDAAADFRMKATGFSIGSKAFIMMGEDYYGGYFKDVWELEPVSNTWIRRADFPGVARKDAVSVVIGDKAYVGLGSNGTYLNDWWEYNPQTDSWTQKANFFGGGRAMASAISVGGSAYVGFGFDGAYKSDMWQYNPVTNTWIQKASCPGGNRQSAASMMLNNKGYFGCGKNASSFLQDWWEYNPANNVWTVKATFPQNARQGTTTFSFNQKGYLVGGEDASNSFNDCWEYQANNNQWVLRDGLNTYLIGISYAVGFSIGSKGYCAVGKLEGQFVSQDVFKYHTLLDSYAWSPGGGTGDTYTFITGTNAETHTLTVTDVQGCEAQATKVIQPTLNPVLNITSNTPKVCFACPLSISASGANSYNWFPGNLSGSSISPNLNTHTTYYVVGTSSAGCTSTASFTQYVVPPGDFNQLYVERRGKGCYPNVDTLMAYSGSMGVNTLPTTLTSNGNNDYIQYVEFLGYSQSSGAPNTTGLTSYMATTKMIRTMAFKDTFTLKIQVANGGTEFAAAWVDWDRNGQEDSNEYYVIPLTLNTVNNTWAGQVLITRPLGYQIGRTTIRIRACRNTQPLYGQMVSSFSFGETEDHPLHLNVPTYYNFQINNPANVLITSIEGGIRIPVPYQNSYHGILDLDYQCCSTIQFFSHTKYPVQISLDAAPYSTMYCPGDTITLSASFGSNPPTSAIWNGQQGGLSHTVSPNVTSYYLMEAVDGNGCYRMGTTTLNVAPQHTYTITSNQNPMCNQDTSNLVISSSSLSNYVWQPGNINSHAIDVSPLTNTVYTVTATDANNCSTVLTYLLEVIPCPTTLNLKMYLQGYFNAIDTSLLPVLMNQGINAGPQNCDTLELGLYDVSQGQITHTAKGILQTNGMLNVSFPAGTYKKLYYLVIQQRNHILTWSSVPLLLIQNTNYDFTNMASKAYASNQIEVAPGVFAIFTGDINQDGVVDGLDYNEWENDSNNFAGGYFSTDLNGDGIVDGLDFIYWEINSNNFVGAVVP